MKKLTTYFFYTLVLIFSAKADVPGKEKMNESKVVLQGLANLQNHTFFYVYHYGNKIGTIKADTTLIIPPSGGAPDGIELWAVNNKTGKSTDTLEFGNYYSPNAVIQFEKIENDSIYYQKSTLSNKNGIVEEENTDIISNKQLVTEANQLKKKHYTKIILLSLAAVTALSALVWIFIRKRKARTENPV